MPHAGPPPFQRDLRAIQLHRSHPSWIRQQASSPRFYVAHRFRSSTSVGSPRLQFSLKVHASKTLGEKHVEGFERDSNMNYWRHSELTHARMLRIAPFGPTP